MSSILFKYLFQSEIAARRRARIMQQMSQMQKNFIRNNYDLFEEINVDMSVSLAK